MIRLLGGPSQIIEIGFVQFPAATGGESVGYAASILVDPAGPQGSLSRSLIWGANLSMLMTNTEAFTATDPRGFHTSDLAIAVTNPLGFSYLTITDYLGNLRTFSSGSAVQIAQGGFYYYLWNYGVPTPGPVLPVLQFNGVGIDATNYVIYG